MTSSSTCVGAIHAFCSSRAMANSEKRANCECSVIVCRWLTWDDFLFRTDSHYFSLRGGNRRKKAPNRWIKMNRNSAFGLPHGERRRTFTERSRKKEMNTLFTRKQSTRLLFTFFDSKKVNIVRGHIEPFPPIHMQIRVNAEKCAIPSIERRNLPLFLQREFNLCALHSMTEFRRNKTVQCFFSRLVSELRSLVLGRWVQQQPPHRQSISNETIFRPFFQPTARDPAWRAATGSTSTPADSKMPGISWKSSGMT